MFALKHGSWLNIAEIGLSTRQGLRHRVGNREELEQQITEWYQERNRNEGGAEWRFGTKDARIKSKRPYPSIKS